MKENPKTDFFRYAVNLTVAGATGLALFTIGAYFAGGSRLFAWLFAAAWFVLVFFLLRYVYLRYIK